MTRFSDYRISGIEKGSDPDLNTSTQREVAYTLPSQSRQDGWFPSNPSNPTHACQMVEHLALLM